MDTRYKALLVVLVVSLTGLVLYLAVAGQGPNEGPPPRARLVHTPEIVRGGRPMPAVKVLELVGSSPRDWHDAVENAVKEAQSLVSDVVGVEVYNWTANVRNGNISEYKANVKVAYSDKGS